MLFNFDYYKWVTLNNQSTHNVNHEWIDLYQIKTWYWCFIKSHLSYSQNFLYDMLM